MANAGTSRRGTRWDRFLLDPAFRRGFEDYRAGFPFCPEYDKRSMTWQWSYETGRQFAASPHAKRWKVLSTETTVSPTLIKAYRRALADKDVHQYGKAAQEQ